MSVRTIFLVIDVGLGEVLGDAGDRASFADSVSAKLFPREILNFFVIPLSRCDRARHSPFLGRIVTEAGCSRRNFSVLMNLITPGGKRSSNNQEQRHIPRSQRPQRQDRPVHMPPLSGIV